jgi:hypothetical protein
MGFDACYYPGLTEQEANPHFDELSRTEAAAAGLGAAARKPGPKYGSFNLVDQPYYFTGPQALVGTSAQREKFLNEYLFNLRAPTDNQPYFFHTFRWASFGQLQNQYGQGSRSFLEVSYIMLLVSVSQAVLLAIILILLPLAPGIKALRQASGKTVTFGYFLMLGLGFMLLEMGFVQKLVLYLAHPIYAAAVVIASFLVFAGLGSQLSRSWRMRAERVVLAAGGVVIGFAAAFLLALDAWLNLTQSWGVPARCVMAALTIAPLAFALGHFFPMGLQRTARANPALVPWSWAVNGFASVIAAAAAPLLAMRFGFSWVVVGAMGCYVVAGLLFARIPQTAQSAQA